MALREIILQAIDDKTTEWDDMLIKILDSLFNYQD